MKTQWVQVSLVPGERGFLPGQTIRSAHFVVDSLVPGQPLPSEELVKRLRVEVANLGLIHHSTLTPSKRHDPENVRFKDCPGLTCRRAMQVASGTHPADLEPPWIERVVTGTEPDEEGT